MWRDTAIILPEALEKEGKGEGNTSTSLRSLIAFPRRLLLGEPKQKSACKRDRVMSPVAVNAPGHNTGPRRMQRKRRSQHKVTLPALHRRLVLFLMLSVIKVRSIHIQRRYYFVGKPGAVSGKTCMCFRLCSLCELSPPLSVWISSSGNGDIVSATRVS